jgi:hypothetical protein
MTIMREIAMDNLPPDWETWRCTAGSCPQERVHVRRRSLTEDVWLIYERPGWVMAATVPVCPACGATLTRETVAHSGTANRPTKNVPFVPPLRTAQS